MKRTTQPSITPSMRIVLSDLKLTELSVIHAGDATFPLSKEIRAITLQDLMAAIKPLR